MCVCVYIYFICEYQMQLQMKEEFSNICAFDDHGIVNERNNYECKCRELFWNIRLWSIFEHEKKTTKRQTQNVMLIFSS